MGRKTKIKPKTLAFKCRKLDENALKNIKSLFYVTDWSCLDNICIEEPYEKCVIIINEYTDIYAPLKTLRVPPKCIIREPWMTKGNH